jgi:hypothetical protein
MNDAIAQYFTGIEAEKRKALLTLMNEWKDSLVEKQYGKDFSADGFFPNYYSQKHKVLFIGREPRWITSGADNVIHGDYIGTSLGWLKNDIQKDTSFWGRILRIVQFFKSDGRKEYEQLSAKDCAEEMTKNNDYGFAIMNISKYSNNDDDGGRANYKLINQFLEDSQFDKHKYFQEELKILAPDYIITFDLWNGKIKPEYLKLCFGEKKPKEEYPKLSPDGRLFEIEIDGNTNKLLDIYHPATPLFVKDDKGCFYMPIKELLFPDGK